MTKVKNTQQQQDVERKVNEEERVKGCFNFGFDYRGMGAVIYSSIHKDMYVLACIYNRSSSKSILLPDLE